MLALGVEAEKLLEKTERELAREAFFLDFAKETTEKFPNLVLMLVGGFRSRTGAEPMVESFASDPVGLSY
jgi:hypothetical protein